MLGDKMIWRGIARVDPNNSTWYIDNIPVSMILKHGYYYCIIELGKVNKSRPGKVKHLYDSSPVVPRIH